MKTLSHATKAFCILMALSAAPTGCVGSDESSEDFEEEEEATPDVSAITNGTPTDDYPSVGYFVNGNGACTATLIAPTAVLTAAHCVGSSGSGYVEFGTNAGGWTAYSYSTIHVHPGYTGNYPINDIAVVILDSAVQGVAPSAIRAKAVRTKQPITLVGFGYTSNGGSNSEGNKYVGGNRISAVNKKSFEYKGAASNICSGDSGGPSFINGQVAGVHSSSTGVLCGGTGWDVRVDVYANWIKNKAGL